MNASCHGQCISDNLIRCCLFDKKKKEIVYKEKSEMGFDYRKSILQDDNYIVLGAEFELKKAPIEEALKELKDAYEKKDADACETANQKLMTAFQAASADMYNATNAQQADPQAGAQGPFSGQQNTQSDNKAAEDVDFEEVK
jgi:hypothetical protein